jgi:hypothetical protein
MSGTNSLDSEVGRLLEWLETQGYSLQMQVARIFSSAGFDVSQFEIYIDPSEGKLREIDVLASVTRAFNGFTVSVAFLIECKHGGEHQWVVFTSPRRVGRWFHFARVLREKPEIVNWQHLPTLQSRLISRILASPTFRDTRNSRFLSIPQSLGSMVVEAHMPKSTQSAKGGKAAKGSQGINNAHSAVMQVTSCVQAYDMQDEMMFQRIVADHESSAGYVALRVSDLSLYARIAFPVVTVGGNLFECCLDQNGEVTLSRADRSVVLIPIKNPDDPAMIPSHMSAVTIVTQAHIEDFAAEAYQVATGILAEERAIREVWSFERERLYSSDDREELPF